MKEEIGERLKNIRKNMDMNKEQFAKLIGISGQYLGTVERGINGLTIGRIKRICDETGVTADYLLFGKGNLLEQMSATNILNDFSIEQIQIAFEIIKKVAIFLKTDNANEILIKNIFLGYVDISNKKG